MSNEVGYDPKAGVTIVLNGLPDVGVYECIGTNTKAKTEVYSIYVYMLRKALFFIILSSGFGIQFLNLILHFIRIKLSSEELTNGMICLRIRSL